MGNIIVGLIFIAIFVFAFKKSYSDAKNNKCASCGSSGSCSRKNKCH